MSISLRYLFAFCFCCLMAAELSAAKNDWAEGLSGKSTGATRDYYNRAGLLKWDHFMGDWRDAENTAQGKKPFAKATIVDTDKARFIEWDVTNLVQQWLNGTYQNQGFFLRSVKGSSNLIFQSKEHNERKNHPQLVITANNKLGTLAPAADTFLAKSTYQSQGNLPSIRIGSASFHALLRFDLSQMKKVKITKAVLRLFTSKQYGTGVVGVFRCSQGDNGQPSQPVTGLATRYPEDKGIAKDPAVIFFCNFDTLQWEQRWSQVGVKEQIQTISTDKERMFSPFQNKALSVNLAKGTFTALNTLYKFKKENGNEPEELYFRYYLRLGKDWNQTVQGGKMPGISGTYGKAGWGGRKCDGTKGWSARGTFFQTIPKGNPLGGLHPIGTYCYHADMKGTYGDSWVWKNNYHGFLKNNQWYCIEQYLKMNTPGKKDGILKAWVDGKLAFEKQDIRFRHLPKLKIEQIWMNVYHGGKIPSPYDQHLFIDNVVIANKYIGPLHRK